MTPEPTQTSSAEHELILPAVADLIKKGAEHRRWKQLHEAENFLLEATNLAEQHLGDEHQVYGYALSDLACLQEEMGKPLEARENFVKALTILERHLGNEHPDTVGIFGRLHHLFRF